MGTEIPRGGDKAWSDEYIGPWDKEGTIPKTKLSLTTRMVPALRWAAVSHFNVLLIARGKVTVSSNYFFF